MKDVADTGRRAGDLAVRLASAAILIPFAFFVVFEGGWWLAGSSAAFAAIMGFEWCRMAGQGPYWTVVLALALINLGFGFLNAFNVSMMLAAFAFLFGLYHRKRFTLAAFGMMYAGGLPFALQVLREGGPWNGMLAALTLMVIVWASDSGAYFAGRLFGGPTLSTNSPNKTWSGAMGAIGLSMTLGAVVANYLGSPIWLWLAMGSSISIVAQLGDLLESQIKRQFGVKDVSGFVPGHGGVMDRVDGLGAVCVVAVAVFLASPGLAAALGF
ncbi:MAG: phosphatidate cytidylyltransferase [Pseudomonadota bacterium]